MPAEDLPIRRDLVIPQDELLVETSRAGGPGGQHVNKVATRVSLRWSIAESRVLDDVRRERLLEKLASRLTREGELIVHVDETRSQARNRELARARLAEIVRRALAVPRKRRPTRPTRASQKRRRASKQRRADVKRQRRPPRADD